MIDGYGGPPLRNSVIIVEGSKIKAIGQVGTLAVPVDAEVISTEGMTVLPGLWDMHVHVMLLGHADYAHWDATSRRIPSGSSCRLPRSSSSWRASRARATWVGRWRRASTRAMRSRPAEFPDRRFT